MTDARKRFDQTLTEASEFKKLEENRKKVSSLAASIAKKERELKDESKERKTAVTDLYKKLLIATLQDTLSEYNRTPSPPDVRARFNKAKAILLRGTNIVSANTLDDILNNMDSTTDETAIADLSKLSLDEILKNMNDSFSELYQWARKAHAFTLKLKTAIAQSQLGEMFDLDDSIGAMSITLKADNKELSKTNQELETETAKEKKELLLTEAAIAFEICDNSAMVAKELQRTILKECSAIVDENADDLKDLDNDIHLIHSKINSFASHFTGTAQPIQDTIKLITTDLTAGLEKDMASLRDQHQLTNLELETIQLSADALMDQSDHVKIGAAIKKQSKNLEVIDRLTDNFNTQTYIITHKLNTVQTKQDAFKTHLEITQRELKQTETQYNELQSKCNLLRQCINSINAEIATLEKKKKESKVSIGIDKKIKAIKLALDRATQPERLKDFINNSKTPEECKLAFLGYKREKSTLHSLKSALNINRKGRFFGFFGIGKSNMYKRVLAPSQKNPPAKRQKM